MTTSRTYDDGCAAAHALDLVGDRWALLVVRELILGPKRFTDLRAGLPNASPNVLSQRLRDLESHGVVRRRVLPPPASARVYELTEWGMELEPVLVRLGRWGARSPQKPPDASLGTDSLILSLRTMFDAGAASGLDATYGLRFGEDGFAARVNGGRFRVVRGEARDPDATFVAASNDLAAVIYGGRDLDDALASGEVVVEGDRSAAERFLRLFPLPAPAPPVAV